MAQPEAAPSPTPLPLLWRAGDVAEFYGVDESTVHRWERGGGIRGSRRDPGGTKYWLREEIVGDAVSATTAAGETTDVFELVAATRSRRRRR